MLREPETLTVKNVENVKKAFQDPTFTSFTFFTVNGS
jgi:hypothetical protein